MKHNYILNFLWWLATPFFIIFFFLILLLFTTRITYINSFLYLTIFLVTIPLFIDWLVAKFFSKNEKLRPKISVFVFLFSFLLTYIFMVKNFTPIIKFFYIIFTIQIILSFIIRFIKQNQYTFLIGVFLATTIIFSLIMVYDLYYLIIIELFFAGIFMKYFGKYKMDTANKMLLNFSIGIASTFITALIFFYFTNI